MGDREAASRGSAPVLAFPLDSGIMIDIPPSRGRRRCSAAGAVSDSGAAMSVTSATLLERLRDRNDAEAWRLLVDLYTPLLTSWLRRYALQDADVDDLV